MQYYTFYDQIKTVLFVKINIKWLRNKNVYDIMTLIEMRVKDFKCKFKFYLKEELKR